jgi:hypothetical protein
MNTKKHSKELMLFGAAILLIVACNLYSPSLQTPDRPPVVTQMEPPPLASTRPPTTVPVRTFTPLPPMPDFDEVLSFGGGGAGNWGCSESEYPSVPNAIRVIGNFGQNVFLCVFVRGIDSAKPMKVNLSQMGGDSITLTSKNLMFDRNGEAVLWEESLDKGIINRWKADGSIFFTLAVWWPVTLPSGPWRVTVYQEGGFRISEDFQISKENQKAYIDALDPHAREEVIPGSPWAGNHMLHLNRNGNLDIYGLGYSPNTPVYLLLYLDNKLVQKKVVVSDGSGTISDEFAGPFTEKKSYMLYGITDPNTNLDGTNVITCYSAIGSAAGAACDYFEVAPAIVRSSCPGAPLQRMIVNERGYVCTQSDSIRVRVSPARSASTLFQLKPDTYFTVIGGPACSDNWSWWNIRMPDGTTGWVSEGGDEIDQYFICPD